MHCQPCPSLATFAFALPQPHSVVYTLPYFASLPRLLHVLLSTFLPYLTVSQWHAHYHASPMPCVALPLPALPFSSDSGQTVGKLLSHPASTPLSHPGVRCAGFSACPAQRRCTLVTHPQLTHLAPPPSPPHFLISHPLSAHPETLEPRFTPLPPPHSTHNATPHVSCGCRQTQVILPCTDAWSQGPFVTLANSWRTPLQDWWMRPTYKYSHACWLNGATARWASGWRLQNKVC